jgi:rhodanese-related sulfurtransferase
LRAGATKPGLTQLELARPIDGVGDRVRSGRKTSVMSEIERHRTINHLLREARAHLERVSPATAATAAAGRSALLVDIRGDHQRDRDGLIPGAFVVARNVLEWRLDPSCPHRDERLTGHDVTVILICNEGYQSSLAAAELREIGVDATDVEGGFQAWHEAQLPVTHARPSDAPA